MTVPLIFSVLEGESYRAGGRMDWAADLARQGAAAMAQGEYAGAVTHYLESVEAFPHPTSLRRLGVCLLLDKRPADAVLYLAAAVELSNRGRRARPLILLAMAFLAAWDESGCARVLRNGAESLPEIIRDRVAEALRGGWRKTNLPELVDELLGMIPKEFDAAGAKSDPPLSCWRLAYVYGLRSAESSKTLK